MKVALPAWFFWTIPYEVRKAIRYAVKNNQKITDVVINKDFPVDKYRILISIVGEEVYVLVSNNCLKLHIRDKLPRKLLMQ